MSHYFLLLFRTFMFLAIGRQTRLKYEEHKYIRFSSKFASPIGRKRITTIYNCVTMLVNISQCQFLFDLILKTRHNMLTFSFKVACTIHVIKTLSEVLMTVTLRRLLEYTSRITSFTLSNL